MTPRRLFFRMAVGYTRHPKIRPLSDAAFRCHVEAIDYSRDQLTDGFLARRLALAMWSLEALQELCSNDPDNPSLIEREEGWYIHDFAAEQDTKEVIQARTERAKNAGRQGGLAKAKRTAKRTASKMVSEPLSKNLAETETKTGGLSLVPSGENVTLDTTKEPPRQCDSHINDPNPPKCGRCAEVRKAHEAWTTAQQLHEKASRVAIRAAIDACHLCDDRGLIEVRDNAASRCNHQEVKHA